MAVQTRLFKRNQSQAVRLPKGVAFPETVKDARITALGNKRNIEPADQARDDWFDSPGGQDFMADRSQPEDQFRKDL